MFHIKNENILNKKSNINVHPTTIGRFHGDQDCFSSMPGHVFLEDQTKGFFERREMWDSVWHATKVSKILCAWESDQTLTSVSTILSLPPMQKKVFDWSVAFGISSNHRELEVQQKCRWRTFETPSSHPTKYRINSSKPWYGLWAPSSLAIGGKEPTVAGWR